MLVQCGAEVIALSRTQADLDSLKHDVCLVLITLFLIFDMGCFCSFGVILQS